MSQKNRKLSAIIVGAGHRGMKYSSYATEHPDELEIVGVVDPSDSARECARETYGIDPDNCFTSVEDLVARPVFADFIINGTMDQLHLPTSIPLLEHGYDMLLEKPFATSEEEMWELVEAARRLDRHVFICHVLRHAPFYATIRQKVVEGAIGDLLNIQAVEHVSYHHMITAFVRGAWSRRDISRSTFLMAKSCHDLDLIAWMKSGIRPRAVSSFGGNFQFAPEKTPEGAGTRCLVDCSIEPDCIYSARQQHLNHPERWKFYVWGDLLKKNSEPTEEERIEYLNNSIFGKCVWKTGMDIVDHQSVAIDFEDGCTATLNMIGSTAKPTRTIHLLGTTGEIQGCLEDSKFVIRKIDTRPGHEHSVEVVDVGIEGDMHGQSGGHGGGDLRLVADVLNVLNGKPPSLSTTSLEDSISSHLIGFCADRSREEQRVVEIDFSPLQALAETGA